MLTGVEVVGDQWSEGLGHSLRAVQPDLVKLRYPVLDLVRGVHAALPDARFLLRPSSEGVNASEIRSDLNSWRTLMSIAGLTKRVFAYEVANEPNNPNHGIEPEWWAHECTLALDAIIPWPFPLPLCSPGLMPHVRITEWRDAIGRVPHWTYYGGHLYFQQDGPETGARNAVTQIAHMPMIATEVNAGSPWPGGSEPAERVELVMQAMRELVTRKCSAAILFAHDRADHPEMIYALTDQRRILLAGRVPTGATMNRKPVYRYGFADFAAAHPEIGRPLTNERRLVPDVAIQITEMAGGDKGVLIYFDGDPAGVRFEPRERLR